jgi:hypothetical protein
VSDVPVINPLVVAPFAGRPDVGLQADVSESDRRAVERLIFTYSYNWDSRDAAATAELFTETADVSFFTDGSVEAASRTIGREQLLEGMTVRTAMLKRWRVETRHLMMNTVFGPSEDDLVHAVTTAVIFWQQLPDHPKPVAVQTGYYRSCCIKTESGWRFQRRETHLSGVFHPRQLYQKP